MVMEYNTQQTSNKLLIEEMNKPQFTEATNDEQVIALIFMNVVLKVYRT
jgi:hypothetical protein